MAAPFSGPPQPTLRNIPEAGASTGFHIITIDERRAERRGIKMVIFGKSGIGKTSLLWTLDPETTLFFDMEAGDLAIEGWPGVSVRPRTWAECRDFGVFVGGPNPAVVGDGLYGQEHYEAVRARYGDPAVLGRFHTLFFDSITVAARLCLGWAQTQPEAFSEKIDAKTGRPKPDLRGAYGLHARAMLQWLTHLQHTRDRNIILVGILDERVDDFNRRIFVPQLEGSKTGLELPGIVDQVVSMVELRTPEGQPYRAFVCRTLNDWGYPAKDRSGRLEMVEEPHLGRLMDKIRQPLLRPAAARLEFGRPSAPAADPASPNPSDGTRGA
jgi:hypothetical protein